MVPYGLQSIQVKKTSIVSKCPISQANKSLIFLLEFSEVIYSCKILISNMLYLNDGSTDGFPKILLFCKIILRMICQ